MMATTQRSRAELAAAFSRRLWVTPTEPVSRPTPRGDAWSKEAANPWVATWLPDPDADEAIVPYDVAGSSHESSRGETAEERFAR